MKKLIAFLLFSSLSAIASDSPKEESNLDLREYSEETVQQMEREYQTSQDLREEQVAPEGEERIRGDEEELRD